jgi:glutathione S-transferase
LNVKGDYAAYVAEHLQDTVENVHVLSMADIVALCTIDFAGQLNGLPIPADHRNLARWHRGVSARPSAGA